MAALFAAAFALRFGLAVGMPNIFRLDELFQTLEPAHRLLTGWGVVSWEWREGIRSFLFPGLLAGLMRLGSWLLPGRGDLLLVTAALSALSLAPVSLAMRLGRAQAGLAGALFAGGVAAVWPDLVYFGPKPLTEVQAGNLLCLALALACTSGRASRLAAIGGLLGLALCLRVQLAPALLLAGAWVGLEERRAGRAGAGRLLCAGAALPLVVLGVLDLVTLGAPFQSLWKNVAVNLLEGRSRDFGVEPAGYYIAGLMARWGMGLPVLALLFLLGASGAMAPAATALAVLLVHSAVAHKEISFIYAAIPLALAVALLGCLRAIAWAHARFGARLRAGPLRAAALGMWLLLAGSAWAQGGFFPALRSVTSYLQALRAVHDLPDVCGLIVFWAGWPSYALMDRAIPSYLPTDDAGLAAARPAANYLMVSRGHMAAVGDAEVTQCWADICLMHSPRQCRAAPEYEVNRVFPRLGY